MPNSYQRFLDKLHQNKGMRALSAFLLSPAFPVLSALYFIYCYLNYNPLAVILFVAAVGGVSALLMKNTAPVLTVLMLACSVFFFNVNENQKLNTVAYYSENRTVIIGCIAVFAFSALLRVLLTKKKANLSLLALSLFGIAILPNGILYPAYEPMSTYFSLFISILLLLSAVFFYCTVEKIDDIVRPLAFAAIGLTVLLLFIVVKRYAVMSEAKSFQLTIVYLRNHFTLGLGNRNSIGIQFVIAIPCILSLVAREKHGTVYLLFATVALIGCYLTMSRQSAIVGTLVYLLSVIYATAKSKHRLPLLFCEFLLAAGFAIVFRRYQSWILTGLSEIYNDVNPRSETFTLAGRLPLWKTAIAAFKQNPIFGEGFYAYKKAKSVIPSVLPSLYHNTILQTFASCGLVGAIPYFVHRVTFFVSYLKNRNPARFFVFFAALSILLVGLVDIHFYDYLPTVVYGSLVGILAATEKKEGIS